MSPLITFLLAVTVTALIPATPTTTPESPPPGLWRGRGIAQVVEIGRQEFVLYDVTDVSSIEADRGAMSEFYKVYRRVASRPSEDELVLWDEGVFYHFDRIQALPGVRIGPKDTIDDPVLNFETLWHYFDENYCGFEARGVDWRAIHERFRPRVTPRTSEAELWTIFAEMLEALNDPHVFASNRRDGDRRRVVRSARPDGPRAALEARRTFATRAESSELYQASLTAWNFLIKQEVLRGRFESALEGKFVWGWPAPDVGYLDISRMTGLVAGKVDVIDPVVAAVDSCMQSICQEFAGARALVVDVRLNPGGNDVIPLAIARWFATEPGFHTTRFRHRGQWSPAETTHFVPRDEGGFRAPVYLLVSGNTVSAAEVFVQYMRGFSHVTVIGEPTRGALAGAVFKALPAGGIVGVPVGLIEDMKGVSYEGRGIRPDVEVASFDTLRWVTGYRGPIDEALRLARR